MSWSRRRVPPTALAVLGLALAAAGCGSTAAPSSSSPASRATGPDASSLSYSEATSDATWASLPMGAPSGPNEFWQLFLLRHGQQEWKLDTPPDIATNGALELGGLAGTSLVVGVRPSLYLTFSPVTVTSNAGATWAAGPPAKGLASVPDALAGAAGDRSLLALSTADQVSTSSVTANRWTGLTTQKSLAAAPAGRACGLTRLTAVGYSPAGSPLVAGSCRKAGVAPLFARTTGTWQLVALPVPAALTGSTMQVLRLVSVPGRTTALLLAQAGSRSDVFEASLGNAGAWISSAPLRLGTARIRASAFSAAGALAVLLTTGRAAILPGPAGSWRQTADVPTGRAATLALPGAGQPEALVATSGTLSVWRLTGSGRWTKIQAIKVPIQYGSSS